MGLRNFAKAAAFVCGVAISAIASAQDVITQWNFNANSLVPSIGAGTISTYGGVVQLFDGSGAVGQGVGPGQIGSSDPNLTPARAMRINNNPPQGAASEIAGVEFRVSTTAFQNIAFRWDQRHSSTYTRFIRLQYSTDGGVTYVQGPIFEATSGGDLWYNQREFAFPAAANNRADLRVRLTPTYSPTAFTDPTVPPQNYGPNQAYRAASDGSAYADGGNTARFDMVTFVGTPLAATPISGNASASPLAVCNTGGPFSMSVSVTPGTNPASSGVSVSANLTSVGGGASVAFTDQGGNIWTLNASVAGGTSPGVKNIPITITDAQGRTGSATVNVTVANCSLSSAAPVVISQVYGGGGNQGPPAGVFSADFVEIYNRSGAPVNLDGWSLQYAGPTTAPGFDNPNDRVALSGVIRPGQAMLVQMSPVGLVGSALPTPDFVAPLGGMGNNSGRVALVNSTTLIGSACASGSIVDLVGYGSAAICFEGAAPTIDTENDTGAIRKSSGLQDSNQNFNDFLVATPSPRNRSTGGFLAGLVSGAASQCAGTEYTLTVNVTPAPGSTGIAVSADLSSMGLGIVPLADLGGSFSTTFAIPASLPEGSYPILVTTSDAQGRTDVAPDFVLGVAQCKSSTARVVISGLFGGGGNNGALVQADYVELFNRSATVVDVRDLTVQYSSAAGVNGFLSVVPVFGGTAPGFDGFMQPGSYLLVRMGPVGANGFPFPSAPDVVANPAVSMDNQFGRVALVSGTSPIGNDIVGNPAVIDLVGYGPTALNFEGLAPSRQLDNTVQLVRRLDGCQDTQQNGLDIDVVPFSNFPRNRFSPATVCGSGVSCSIADITGVGGPPALADDQLTVDDIIAYVNAFGDGSLAADVTSIGGPPAGPDQQLTVDDVIAFVNAFGDGC